MQDIIDYRSFEDSQDAFREIKDKLFNGAYIRPIGSVFPGGSSEAKVNHRYVDF